MSTPSDSDTPLWVYVPNTSKDIQLSPQGWDEQMWLPTSRLNFALFGEPPFSETEIPPLVTDVGRSSLFHNFTGTRIVVEGTVEPDPNNRTRWRMTCQVDGKDIAVAPDSLVRNRLSNGVPLCDSGGLSPDGVHSLNFTIHIDPSGLSPSIYFDILKVTPSASTNLENALVYLHHNASIVSYENPSWQVTDLGHHTSTNGSKVVVKFSGTKLKWFGFYDPSLGGSGSSREESKGSFVLDQYPPVTFTIPHISSAPTATQIGLPHFTTVELPPGKHHLEVTYTSTSGRPLGLHHLMIQNAPLPAAISQTPKPSVSPLSTSTQLPTSAGISRPAIIAIAVNMIVGGLFVIGIVIYLWRRQQKINRKKAEAAERVQPYDTDGLNPHMSSLQVRSPKLASAAGTEARGPSSPSETNSKGTHIAALPIRRGSLHIRSWDKDEGLPPYKNGSGVT